MATVPYDLVILIDTSESMKDEAAGLSAAAAEALRAAAARCPSDLRVVWLGIEGTWRDTPFTRSLREYLIGGLSIPEAQLKSHKRAPGGRGTPGANEDAGPAIEDLVAHFDWRPAAQRAILYVGDEAFALGGEKLEQDDIDAANGAIAAARAAKVVVHTYFATSRASRAVQREYARVAEETGGKAFSAESSLAGFAPLLQEVLCACGEAGAAADPPVSDAECRVKTVVHTSSLFSAALERLNRRSALHLVEQVIAEVNAHCERLQAQAAAGSGALIALREELLVLIAGLRQSGGAFDAEVGELKQRLAALQTQELTAVEITQIEALFQQLLARAEPGLALRVEIEGRTFDLRRLLMVLATADQVARVHILHGDEEIEGARFELTDGVTVHFQAAREVSSDSALLTYRFSTRDWRGLTAGFSLVFRRRQHKLRLCERELQTESFDGVEQGNLVFDLCPRIAGAVTR